MKRNLTPIASGVALFLMGAAMAAQAQTAAPIEQVVTTGIRASLQQSLNQKKNSDAIVEVITAEDVGKMPDKNVADSLQRLPGVMVAAAGAGEGSFGENDRVALRGTPFALTLTTLNGHSVSSGDWFADNIVTGGRSVSFTLLPSELIGRVVVHKGSQADLVEGGAMGVVDIQTRKPLDFKNAINAEVSAGVVNSSSAKKTDPLLNGLVAWKNDASTLGVMVQAFYEKRHLSRIGQENDVWGGGQTADAGTSLATAVGGPALLVPYLAGSTWFQQVRTKKGGLVDVQLKPSNDFSLDLTVFHSHMDAPNMNSNFMQEAGRMFGPSWAGAGASYPVGNIKGTLNNGVITQLAIAVDPSCTTPNTGACNGISSAVQEEFDRPVAASTSQFVDLTGKLRVNSNLTLTGDIGSTKGIGTTTSGAMGIYMPFTGVSYTMHGLDVVTYNTPGSGTFSEGGFNNGGVPGGANPYTYGSIVTSNDKENYASLDGEYKTSMPVIDTVKFGARVSQHTRSLSMIGINNAPDSGDGGLANAANLPLAGLTDFTSLDGGSYWTFNQASVTGWLAKYTVFNQELIQNEFSIKEPTASAYMMAVFGGEGFAGNFGGRLVHTSEEVKLGNNGGSLGVFNNSYMDILPSANIRFDLAKNLIGRFAVGRTMARPELGQMAGLNLLDVQGTGTVGNPHLKPVYANSGDAALEWYFAPKSLVSVDAFVSELDGYVSYGSGTQMFFNQIQHKDTLYVTAQPINSSAQVKGLEFNYQQDLGGGFGLNTNYTYTLGEETGHMPGSACGAVTNPDCTMIGTSKNAYNLGAYYENDKFNARLTYSWRSGFLNGNTRNTALFQDSIGTLAASVGYQITNNFSVTLDGKDLNNPLVRSIVHTPGAQDSPGSLYKNGRVVYLQVHAKM